MGIHVANSSSVSAANGSAQFPLHLVGYFKVYGADVCTWVKRKEACD
jgi:hypothetical protein